MDTDLKKLKKEELVELHDQLSYKEEEIKATKLELREEIQSRMKRDAEMWGEYSVSKVKRYKLSVDIEKAKEFGIVKVVEEVDQTKAKKLYLAGAKVPGDMIITEYVLIRNISQEKTEE